MASAGSRHICYEIKKKHSNQGQRFIPNSFSNKNYKTKHNDFIFLAEYTFTAFTFPPLGQDSLWQFTGVHAIAKSDVGI